MQSRVAMIMPAIFRPSQAPFAKAWSVLADLFSSSGTTTLPAESDSSTSG